jgi:hypothetical protein
MRDLTQAAAVRAYRYLELCVRLPSRGRAASAGIGVVAFQFLMLNQNVQNLLRSNEFRQTSHFHVSFPPGNYDAVPTTLMAGFACIRFSSKYDLSSGDANIDFGTRNVDG